MIVVSLYCRGPLEATTGNWRNLRNSDISYRGYTRDYQAPPTRPGDVAGDARLARRPSPTQYTPCTGDRTWISPVWAVRARLFPIERRLPFPPSTVFMSLARNEASWKPWPVLYSIRTSLTSLLDSGSAVRGHASQSVAKVLIPTILASGGSWTEASCSILILSYSMTSVHFGTKRARGHSRCSSTDSP
jgi:hypothetical protein